MGTFYTLLFSLVLLAGRARAATLYSAPGGAVNARCDKDDPCALPTALEAAADGDTVTLAGTALVALWLGCCGTSSSLHVAPASWTAHRLTVLGQCLGICSLHYLYLTSYATKESPAIISSPWILSARGWTLSPFPQDAAQCTVLRRCTHFFSCCP